MAVEFEEEGPARQESMPEAATGRLRAPETDAAGRFPFAGRGLYLHNDPDDIFALATLFSAEVSVSLQNQRLCAGGVPLNTDQAMEHVPRRRRYSHQ